MYSVYKKLKSYFGRIHCNSKSFLGTDREASGYPRGYGVRNFEAEKSFTQFTGWMVSIKLP